MNFMSQQMKLREKKQQPSKPQITQIETIALDWNKPRFALYSFDKRTETAFSTSNTGLFFVFHISKLVCLHIAVEFFTKEFSSHLSFYLVSSIFFGKCVFETKFLWTHYGVATNVNTHRFGCCVRFNFTTEKKNGRSNADFKAKIHWRRSVLSIHSIRNSSNLPTTFSNASSSHT